MKCSTKNHENQKGYKYCIMCNIFMCHQCFYTHQKLFSNHHLIDLNEDFSKLYTFLCKEDLKKLEYYCRSHNQLCCASCKENKHYNCETSKIEDIKEEKKKNLDKNLNELENLSNNIKERINITKNFYDKVDKLKEDLKSKILKIITNLRNKLNEREDELISEVDKIFSNICPEEKLILNFEKIPKKIISILDQKDALDEKLKDTYLLNSYIIECINIEKELNEIKETEELINKYDINKEIKISFYPDLETEELNNIYNDIKSFGKICQQETDKNNIFINESHKKIHELKTEIKKLKSEIDKKDNENKELQNKIKEIKSDLNDEKSKNSNLKNTINNLNNSKIKFTIRSRCALHKCLDTKSLNYGNSPHLWDYGHNNANQIFELEKNNDGTYSIKSSHSGLYLGLSSNGIAFKWKNENRQSFYLHHFGDGYYLIQERSGEVIDLYSSNTNNGAYIGKYGRNNGNNQQWKLVVHL